MPPLRSHLSTLSSLVRIYGRGVNLPQVKPPIFVETSTQDLSGIGTTLDRAGIERVVGGTQPSRYCPIPGNLGTIVRKRTVALTYGPKAHNPPYALPTFTPPALQLVKYPAPRPTWCPAAKKRSPNAVPSTEQSSFGWVGSLPPGGVLLLRGDFGFNLLQCRQFKFIRFRALTRKIVPKLLQPEIEHKFEFQGFSNLGALGALNSNS